MSSGGPILNIEALLFVAPIMWGARSFYQAISTLYPRWSVWVVPLASSSLLPEEEDARLDTFYCLHDFLEEEGPERLAHDGVVGDGRDALLDEEGCWCYILCPASCLLVMVY
ncbi:hypothetical protein BKA67DRAFT_579151 [Truncatella angustata]|uniref:Uncharacterized protein n=1 Tax=Truncatella angustata TaxID=152316 RepID=A0A9P8UDM9_9PEZI|nr:uncharacterized protein BKA67DRAFT_579151 [Truncatella angustata]KAH6647990.1 hypothetical protein BKA67DRAFT_579151 [Truncatella angustata]